MNILLIGPRASGKTTIGKLLAQRLNRRFVDLDELALTRFQQTSVREVWEKLGEPAWRNAEVHVLQELLTSDHQVIALGGGTPTIPRAQDLIAHSRASGSAQTVYLECAVAQLTDRLAQSPGDRPRLTTQPIADEIAAVAAQRDPIYRSMADLICLTTHRTPAEIVNQLAQQLAD